MELKDVFSNIEYEILQGSTNIVVAGVHYDSRAVKEGFLFVAIKGFDTDGHKYLGSALEKGATVLVISDETLLTDKLRNSAKAIIKCLDTRKILGLLSANFYGHPSNDLNIIGVTGTNGKTSTTYFLNTIFENENYKTAVLGTVNNKIGNNEVKSKLTTPESRDLQELFYNIKKEDCSHVFMEVASHALSLNRCEGVEFGVGVYTNLSQDHLDYHKDMEDYFSAKLKLFKMIKKDGYAIVNMDDSYGDRIVDSCQCNVIKYGIERDDLDLKAKDIKMDIYGTKFTLEYLAKEYAVKLNLIGKFNVYNVLASIATSLALGLEIETVIESVEKLKVPGRFELIENDKGFSVVIDYAHTPDGLENVLIAAKNICTGNVISVFGCGGDRDNSKRAIMGKVSGELADMSVVTSDNPRTENPVTITEMIEVGIKEITDDYIVIVDRKEAIIKALEMAKEKDLVIISGKGHEDYQIIGTEKIHFSDHEIVRDYFNGN